MNFANFKNTVLSSNSRRLLLNISKCFEETPDQQSWRKLRNHVQNSLECGFERSNSHKFAYISTEICRRSLNDSRLPRNRPWSFEMSYFPMSTYQKKKKFYSFFFFIQKQSPGGVFTGNTCVDHRRPSQDNCFWQQLTTIHSPK